MCIPISNDFRKKNAILWILSICWLKLIKSFQIFNRMETTVAPTLEAEENRYFDSMFSLISSLRSPVSAPMEWFNAQTVGVKSGLREFTTSFYNTFLGLTRTQSMYVTETRLSTEYSTFSDKYRYFLITSCLPPNLNYPICPSNLDKDMAIWILFSLLLLLQH